MLEENQVWSLMMETLNTPNEWDVVEDLPLIDTSRQLRFTAHHTWFLGHSNGSRIRVRQNDLGAMLDVPFKRPHADGSIEVLCKHITSWKGFCVDLEHWKNVCGLSAYAMVRPFQQALMQEILQRYPQSRATWSLEKDGRVMTRENQVLHVFENDRTHAVVKHLRWAQGGVQNFDVFPEDHRLINADFLCLDLPTSLHARLDLLAAAPISFERNVS